ncbi:hypothetical protein CJP74_00280 [Psittacicella melopsittaci]|uniref:Outer membrane protein beta-barrel domain-containing protein n=1 Tax=Psittacicella melopsittaci TaxID=2028576 RepID=A0A3A1Y924_9GAMM|nr:hypothetical protein [Psittacicella melopsittaci]RIY34051.1 hypothetical protein CJP74_00280 [Psittacicella melopsittaci]
MKKLLAVSVAALSAALVPTLANATSLDKHFGTVHGVVGGQRVLGENVQSYGVNADYNYRVFNNYGWYVGGEAFFNYGRQNSVNYYNFGAGAKTKYLWETSTDFTPYAGFALGYQQTRASDEFSKHTGGVYGALEVGSLYGKYLDFGVRVQAASLSKDFASSENRGQYTYALYAGVKF